MRLSVGYWCVQYCVGRCPKMCRRWSIDVAQPQVIANRSTGPIVGDWIPQTHGHASTPLWSHNTARQASPATLEGTSVQLLSSVSLILLTPLQSFLNLASHFGLNLCVGHGHTVWESCGHMMSKAKNFFFVEWVTVDNNEILQIWLCGLVAWKQGDSGAVERHNFRLISPKPRFEHTSSLTSMQYAQHGKHQSLACSNHWYVGLVRCTTGIRLSVSIALGFGLESRLVPSLPSQDFLFKSQVLHTFQAPKFT